MEALVVSRPFTRGAGKTFWRLRHAEEETSSRMTYTCVCTATRRKHLQVRQAQG